MAARQAVLGMEHASFYYGASRVFEDVSFLLDDARTALVGENGAGKSTLLKCLAGELELNAGQVIRSRGLADRQRAAGHAGRNSPSARCAMSCTTPSCAPASATTIGASTC